MSPKYPSETVATFLSQTQLLKNCPIEDLFILAEQSTQQHYEPGAVVLPPGLSAAGLGLMLKGKASLCVVDATSGSRTSIDQILPGDPFGEVGLILGSGNPTTVIADEPSDTLLIKKDLFERVIKKHSDISFSLAKTVASRFVQVSLLGAKQTMVAPAAPVADPLLGKSAAPASTVPSGETVFKEIGRYDISSELLNMIPAPMMRKHRMIPLQVQGQKLVVGMVNPFSLEARRELERMLTTVDPEIVAVSADEFNQTFVRLKLDTSAAATGKKQTTVAKNTRLAYAIDQEKSSEKGSLVAGDEVIGIFDQIVLEGVESGASDIHIEPGTSSVNVRFRIQGTMVERQQVLPISYIAPLIARIKVLAQMDITERRKPQDGQITATFGKQEIHMRVSTMAVARGEKGVLRIMDPANIMRPLHQIFMNAEMVNYVRTALSDPYGAIIVAGPTGSGKSSTLYSMLNERKVSRSDSNLVTVEDPVEYQLEGISQVPVIPRIGLTFSDALHGLMRQDPDVIMIGELRDSQTAAIMLEASMTGHLVLTSTHGNDAIAVLQRLEHLGCDRVMLSQAIGTIIVQRLARRLCSHCASEGPVAPALLENLVSRKIVSRAATNQLPRAVGCEACNKQGYAGRVAVHELLYFDDEVRTSIAAGMKPQELLQTAAKSGRFISFAHSAAYLMARRLLSPSDALITVAA